MQSDGLTEGVGVEILWFKILPEISIFCTNIMPGIPVE